MKKIYSYIRKRINLSISYIIESEQAEINNFCSKIDRSAICCQNGTTGAVKAKNR